MGWAASAIIGGAVWQIAGPAPVFVAFSASALLVAALVLMPATRHSTPAPDPPAPALPRHSTPAPDPPAPGPTGPSRGTDAGSLPAKRTTSWLLAQLAAVASPMLVGFLAGVFVTSIGEHATWRFIGLRILDQGGGVFLVGLAAALPAIVEIPVFGSSRRLLARLGLRLMYVWGALIAAVLALLVALAPEAWMVTTLRALDGTSYALRYMAMVVIIGALIPVHLHALGQSLTWLVYAGVAPIVADIAGGLVYEQLGAAALFVAAMLMLLTGGIVVWLALRGPRFGRGASGSVVAHEVEAVALPPPV